LNGGFDKPKRRVLNGIQPQTMAKGLFVDKTFDDAAFIF
jgi:hypothetical protein